MQFLLGFLTGMLVMALATFFAAIIIQLGLNFDNLMPKGDSDSLAWGVVIVFVVVVGLWMFAGAMSGGCVVRAGAYCWPGG